ncbi:hypothetical protein [Imperialibacter roseus]|uniref:Uncharacterized protein n=1 Tax=Imperialibacter roseus TaxID=1324217 RepID=A0ABZ0IYZ3_9BACT|nr:hypothetical protein [Imperialibacter roseus]WOK08902.1 hypothetical protein RT717_09665 [Imperialibacter roseus]|tara:strand:- start:17257 stop:17589 length:333 start_codon:yes stop_codon:yes gene_type:complete
MNHWISIILVLVGGEALSVLLFWILSKIFTGKDGAGISKRSVFKGMVERLFLFFALTHDLPHVLTLLGALKIATRIKDENKISNDYFLVGNLLSISLAIAYFIIWREVLK